MIELNEKQKEGLNLAVARYHAGCKTTVIAGYARNRKVHFS